jgi:peptidoglycan/LPS O-acetylase OafA/YrhL
LILYRNELRWYQAAAALLYLVNFSFSKPWFIGHLWSLSVEEQFYFLWPSVLRKWFRHRTWILIAVVIASPLYSAVCFALKIRGGAYGTFPAVADNLAIGCLAAILVQQIPKITRGAAVCMVAAIILIPQFPADTPLRTLFMLFVLWPLLHISIAGVLLHVVQNPYRLLNLAPVVFLGKISYSLYLWQQVFFFNPHSRPFWLAVGGALGCACLSYFLIEQPMLRLRDRKPRPDQSALVQFAPAGD